MPEELTVRRARLYEIEFDKDSGSRRVDQKGEGGGADGENGQEGASQGGVEVQFNPQSLKVTYKNQKANSDNADLQGSQFVGRGQSQLSVDLLFDATRRDDVEDVRVLTGKVHEFMRVKQVGKDEQGSGSSGKEKQVFVQPGVQFVWGTFLFEGVMDSMNETLEFFDHDGRPLRATVSVTISEQSIQFGENEDFKPSASQSPRSLPSGGGTSGESAPPGPEEEPPGVGDAAPDSIQQLAAERGRQGAWKEIAAANGIENPRAIWNAEAVDFSARRPPAGPGEVGSAVRGSLPSGP